MEIDARIIPTEDNPTELLKRIERLECQVRGLVTMTGIDRTNTKYDVDGVRKATSDLTPYTETKTAYIDDTSLVFMNVPNGNISIFMKDANEQSVPFVYEINNGNLIVTFEKRTSLATVSISIL